MLPLSTQDNLRDLRYLICIFLVSSFYILSQAVDVYLFHFIFDIHLAVIAMLVMFVTLSIINAQARVEYICHFKYLIAIAVLWSFYLLVNGLVGANPRTSVVLLSRFVGTWLIASQLAVFLYVGGKRAWNVISLALLVTFFLISGIWYLQSIDAHFFEWLRPKLRNPSLIKDWGGLYVNPNVLGFALASHAALVIWYTLGQLRSIIIIPLIWLMALTGIFNSRSTNAFVGIMAVGAFGLFAYYQHQSIMPSRHSRFFRFALPIVVLITLIGFTLTSQKRLDRVMDRFMGLPETFWGWSIKGAILSQSPTEGICRVYDETRESYVIAFSEPELSAPYTYEFASSPIADNSSHIAFEWSMSSSEPCAITIMVGTSQGRKELLYSSSIAQADKICKSCLNLDLGAKFADGKWHTISRDLQQDLRRFLPNAEILEVSAIRVQGKGRIDDIKIGAEFIETFESKTETFLRDIKRTLNRIDKDRIEIWERSFHYWLQKPWIGIGFGSFKYMRAEKNYHSHNFLLNTLVEQGLIGFGLLCAFIGVLVWQMKSWLGASLLGSFLCMQLFDDMTPDFSFPVYTSFILGYCFFLILLNRGNPNGDSNG